MRKTTFRVAGMDCPSEEQLIRMQLRGLGCIQSLAFDLPNRLLTVYHTGPPEHILAQLHPLQMEASWLETVPAPDHPASADTPLGESRLLWQVLAINLLLFALELIMGLIASSMGLIADSLDMLADSLVYGLALLAVGGTMARKKNIARAAGYLQLALALVGLLEVIRRVVAVDTVPDFQTMIIISTIALLGNGLCLYLLQKSKSQEAHLQASMIFTSNDVIANAGVILAGGLVYLTRSPYPDLIVGAMVFLIVGRGALRILRLAR